MIIPKYCIRFTHIVIISFMTLMCSCIIKSKGRGDSNMKITVLVDKSTSDAVNNCSDILMKRLEAISESRPEMKVKADTIEFYLKLENITDTADFHSLLSSNGHWGIWECIDNKDINKYRNMLYDSCDSLSELMQPSTIELGGIIGYVNINDTAKANCLLSSEKVKQILPNDYVLAWSAKPLNDKEELMELYALKYLDNKGPALYGNHITSSKAITEFGMPCVSIELDKEGAALFHDLSLKNINHVIAIVVDNKVFSAPMLYAPIEGGKIQISGDFSMSEAKALAAVLSSEPMQSKVTIINIQPLK